MARYMVGYGDEAMAPPWAQAQAPAVWADATPPFGAGYAGGAVAAPPWAAPGPGGPRPWEMPGAMASKAAPALPWAAAVSSAAGPGDNFYGNAAAPPWLAPAAAALPPPAPWGHAPPAGVAPGGPVGAKYMSAAPPWGGEPAAAPMWGGEPAAAQSAPNHTAPGGAQPQGLAFPGAAEDDRERKRRKQQEMQRELAAQIEERERRKKQEQQRLKEEDMLLEARIRQEVEAGAGMPPSAARAQGRGRTDPFGNAAADSGSPQAAAAQAPWQQEPPQPAFAPAAPAFAPAAQPAAAAAPPQAAPGGFAAFGDDQRQERRKQQQEEWQRQLAEQAEAARNKKKEAERRRVEEERLEEERLQREIEKQDAAREAEARRLKERCQVEQDVQRSPAPAAEEKERRRDLRRTRERLRESGEEVARSQDALHETKAEMRKSRERVRSEPRSQRARRPRTGQDTEAPKMRRPAAQSPTQAELGMGESPEELAAYNAVLNTAANTAATWWNNASPTRSPPVGAPPMPRQPISFGMQGFVEQQMQMASEMQKQVDELRRQRDEAREQVLKAREDAINDRAKALTEMQQNLMEQLNSGQSASSAAQLGQAQAAQALPLLGGSPGYGLLPPNGGPGLHAMHQAMAPPRARLQAPAVWDNNAPADAGYPGNAVAAPAPPWAAPAGAGAPPPWEAAQPAGQGLLVPMSSWPDASAQETLQPAGQGLMLPTSFWPSDAVQAASDEGVSADAWEKSMVSDSKFLPVDAVLQTLGKSRGASSSHALGASSSLAGTSRLAPPGAASVRFAGTAGLAGGLGASHSLVASTHLVDGVHPQDMASSASPQAPSAPSLATAVPEQVEEPPHQAVAIQAHAGHAIAAGFGSIGSLEILQEETPRALMDAAVTSSTSWQHGEAVASKTSTQDLAPQQELTASASPILAAIAGRAQEAASSSAGTRAAPEVCLELTAAVEPDVKATANSADGTEASVESTTSSTHAGADTHTDSSATSGPKLTRQCRQEVGTIAKLTGTQEDETRELLEDDAEDDPEVTSGEAVAAKLGEQLGESRATEFRIAVLQAEGLDPELRDGLCALLGSPDSKKPALPAVTSEAAANELPPDKPADEPKKKGFFQRVGGIFAGRNKSKSPKRAAPAAPPAAPPAAAPAAAPAAGPAASPVPSVDLATCGQTQEEADAGSSAAMDAAVGLQAACVAAASPPSPAPACSASAATAADRDLQIAAAVAAVTHDRLGHQEEHVLSPARLPVPPMPPPAAADAEDLTATPLPRLPPRKRVSEERRSRQSPFLEQKEGQPQSAPATASGQRRKISEERRSRRSPFLEDSGVSTSQTPLAKLPMQAGAAADRDDVLSRLLEAHSGPGEATLLGHLRPASAPDAEYNCWQAGKSEAYAAPTGHVRVPLN